MLPDVISRYQAAHDRHDTDAALSTFASNAKVVDDGSEYRGTDAIRGWLETSARAFTFTRQLLGVEPVDPQTWEVSNRLEGDFPGGVVDLRYRFVLHDELIAELVIAP